MKDGATKALEQCYNGQAAVDSHAQSIVATNVTQETNDKQQVQPVFENMKENLGGAVPAQTSADNGYFSEPNVTYIWTAKGRTPILPPSGKNTASGCCRPMAAFPKTPRSKNA